MDPEGWPVAIFDHSRVREIIEGNQAGRRNLGRALDLNATLGLYEGGCAGGFA